MRLNLAVKAQSWHRRQWRGGVGVLSMVIFHVDGIPGQQRSRMLATLFKDERCQQLAAYGILEKMYLDRIIRGNQLQEFAAMLMPHQKATTADGQ